MPKPITKVVVVVLLVFLVLYQLLRGGESDGETLIDYGVLSDPKVQHDMTNVTFPIGPPNQAQLAIMRKHGLETSKVATMIELRYNPQIVPHLLHMISVLEDDWPFRIYHSVENAELFEARQLQRFRKSGKLTLLKMNIDLSKHQAVSDFLAHRPYWDNLAPAKHVLIFQTDSILCSRSNAKVEDFFAYDYIGAPVHWRFHGENETHPGPIYMNGGLSLRNREAILDVIDNAPAFNDPVNKDYWYEDEFFVRHLERMGHRLPTRDVARQFSVETDYYPSPLGVHQVERYMGPGTADEARLAYLRDEWCPEMHMLYGRVGPSAFQVCNTESESYDKAACQASLGQTEPPP